MSRFLCLLMLATAGCGGVENGSGWAGSIDTLATGVIVVRNPSNGVWAGRTEWTLREELRIGSALSEGPDLFGRISGVAVDSEGNLHVLDRQARELRSFGPDGRHLRSVGREGSGPGEFRDPIGLTPGPHREQLYVVDPGNARYAVLTTRGEPVGQIQRRVGGYSVPWNGGFDVRGRFHEKTYTGGRHAVLRTDSLFEPVDTAWFPAFDGEVFTLRTEAGHMTANVPFAAVQVERWDPRGYLWTLDTGEYALVQMDMQADTVRLVHGPEISAAPVTEPERAEAIEGLGWFTRQGGRIEPGRIPSTKPPVATFHVAHDGYLWVRLTKQPDQPGERYHVFDPEGRFLGTVQSAEGLGSAPIFTERAIYGVVSDSLGVQYIVRSAVQRGSG